MQTTCPKCGSGDVYTCDAAYAQGKSDGTHTSTAVGYAGGGHAGVARSRGRSTSLTGFAQRAAPPRSMVGPLVAAAFLILLFGGILSALAHSTALFVLAFLAVVGIGFLVPKAWATHKAKMAVWHDTWICGRCSTRFTPAAAAPLQAAA